MPIAFLVFDTAPSLFIRSRQATQRAERLRKMYSLNGGHSWYFWNGVFRGWRVSGVGATK